MTLNGELDIGGRYDLAFGSLVRKTFVAKPGGRLFWNGNPYEGCGFGSRVHHACERSTALGNGASQVQNEDVEVCFNSWPHDDPQFELRLGHTSSPIGVRSVGKCLATFGKRVRPSRC